MEQRKPRSSDEEPAACRFGGFTLDPGRGALLRPDGTETELRPKTAELLRHLAAKAGRVVTREELLESVWPGVFVGDDSVTQCVAEIRRALGDDGARLLRTLPKRGYLLAAEAPRGERPSASSVPAAADDTPVGADLTMALFAAPARRLSVVVLPFANLNRDPGQDFLADGVTEDLTSELSRLPDFFVIARSTAFTFKGASADIRQIARELGVRYAVEGSVRREGQRVRVTAQLIDAETAAHVWGDRFDRELSGIFDLQETIALELANALGARLVEVESRRSAASADPGVVDLLMRARAALNRASPPGRAEAEPLYEEAVRLAPDDTRALTGLALVLVGRVADQYSRVPDEDLRRAEALATRVVALERDNPGCHYALGVVRRLQSRFDEAHHHLEAALRLNPCWNTAHAQIGWVKAFSGRCEEAWPHFAESIRLSPRDPRLFIGFFGFGWTRFLLGDDEGAVEMLRRAIALNPDYPHCHLGLAAACGMLGHLDEAQAALAAYLRCGTVTASLAVLRERSLSKHPVYLAQRERLLEGLRRAGMPEA
jgi:TolB-like protein/DNA-binding winged helix-turn-helix (wHTH) protein/Tfp pilus assembly protein PilF